MSKKEEFDVDEELKKISRKTNVAAIKSQRSFENQIKKLDVEIDNVINNKLRQFDVDLKLRSDYLSIDYSDPTVKKIREKLKRI
ncbi:MULTISPECIES: hypothetical protein [Methanobrevibacter]|uniref:hypothetical protein n=1 Tax=Methanobrevibacter TaxID=2172 RepID=UPI0025EAD3BF|nr:MULTISPECIES: hypothetical protein [Methanobrevibacter]MBS7257719.1 hypothetical protein [Methanobrevibacter sp.]MCI7429203.1 hypothetical protein [Methanobrevibacter sp.]MDD6776220.1 hypothetical protein [Methanobacteriaceae archaeon]MDY3097494.1 hypothetical protein [Methanobrevibacter sp.]